LKNVFLLTGRPGVGKTTALARAIDRLREYDIHVGGFMSRERRVAGIRQGFELIDLLSHEVGTLADVAGEGPRLGKYRVNLQDLEGIGVTAIETSLERADVTAIDEIGPMELYSEKFGKAIQRALKSPKPIIGTIHSNLRHPIVDEIGQRADRVEVLEVTYETRDRIPDEIAGRILRLLGNK
jgi:nucleoside-triphosphatase